VEKWNQDELPFYLSVPQADLDLFREHLSGITVQIISDDDIVAASPGMDGIELATLPGSLSQQVIKSEFWRLNVSQAYACLDSDAFFIRPFRQSDFLAPDGAPYTVLDEAHELLEDALMRNKPRVFTAFQSEAANVQQLFSRVGRRYSFGPFPLVWDRRVWLSLEREFLQPRGMRFLDAISLCPIESRWYGEALLAYRAVPLWPCQALFKVYHYAWQFDRERSLGITEAKLSELYCGVIYQSAWERHMDWPRDQSSFGSKASRYLRRKLGRI
jgi:hypothetical protein